MNVSIDYQDKSYEFPLWTNKLEKEIILSVDKSIDVKKNVGNVFQIINSYPELNGIHYIDKLYILVKCREYSVGNRIDAMLICKQCGSPESASYKISDSLKYQTQPQIIKTPVGDLILINDIYHLNNIPVDELSADEFMSVKKYLSSYDRYIYIETPHRCGCGFVNIIRHNESQLIHDIVVSMEVAEMYKYYVNMKFNYNISLTDLDNMYTFERSIYNNLFDKIIKLKNDEK